MNSPTHEVNDEETGHIMPGKQRRDLFSLASGESACCSTYIIDHEDEAMLVLPPDGSSRRWS
jgi:hypothetical protein